MPKNEVARGKIFLCADCPQQCYWRWNKSIRTFGCCFFTFLCFWITEEDLQFNWFWLSPNRVRSWLFKLVCQSDYSCQSLVVAGVKNCLASVCLTFSETNSMSSNLNNHFRRQTQQEMTYRYRSPFSSSSSSYLPGTRWLDDLDFDRPFFNRSYWNDRNLRDSHRIADGVGDVRQATSVCL